MNIYSIWGGGLIALICFCTCNGKPVSPSTAVISELNLKKGEVISCGPADAQFGKIRFAFSGSKKISADFNLAVSLLHSFEYEEAEKVFAKVIRQEPNCAMAYWGIAMANFHALWAPPSPAELEKGAKAISIARSITPKSRREADYIAALASFYNQWDTLSHRQRSTNYEQSMEQLHQTYPDDKEATVFYAWH